MIELVADLVARGVAYETADGVYLSVMDVPGYGLLAHQPLDSLRVGARVEADEEKRSPLDFLLWGPNNWLVPFTKFMKDPSLFNAKMFNFNDYLPALVDLGRALRPLAKFPGHLRSDPRVRRLAHQSQSLPDALFGNEAQEG